MSLKKKKTATIKEGKIITALVMHTEKRSFHLRQKAYIYLGAVTEDVGRLATYPGSNFM